MRRLLDVGEDYIDPGNPCEPYVCEVSADITLYTGSNSYIAMYIKTVLLYNGIFTGGWIDPAEDHVYTS